MTKMAKVFNQINQGSDNINHSSDKKMILITDNKNFASEIISQQIEWQTDNSSLANEIPVNSFFADDYYVGESKRIDWWKYLIIIKEAPRSQYDILISLAQNNAVLPDRLLCLAGTGKDFHGFRKRKWEAVQGNIHLSVYLAPNLEIPNFAAPVMALPAVSIIHTIEDIPTINQKPMIKWVNDINFGNAKVAGVLAHTQGQGKTLSNIILGIGLNVEFAPKVPHTPSVPQTIALHDIATNKNDCTKDIVFHKLISKIHDNYQLLINGKSSKIIDIYKYHSIVIHKEVTVYDDSKPKEPIIYSGEVDRIGDNLELFFKNKEKPVIKGRLVVL